MCSQAHNKTYCPVCSLSMFSTLQPSRAGSLSVVIKQTVGSCCSLPPVHRRASPGQVCGHAHQLVRQDQQAPPEGESAALHLCLQSFISRVLYPINQKYHSRLCTYCVLNTYGK